MKENIPRTVHILSAITFAGALWSAQSVNAQDASPVRNAPKFDPAAESNQLGEAQRLDRIGRQRALTQRMAEFAGYGPYYPSVFEPWPYVPGDIWGYRLPAPIAQPIGHESRQVGPNKWTYRPLYPGPLVLQPVVTTGPRAAVPRTAPSREIPASRPLPPSAREF